MNKFNKKLTISLPEDPIFTQQNQSPSAPGSNNHQKYQRQSSLQFRQFRDGGDSEYGDQRNSPKLNFVQFQQFNVNNYDNNRLNHKEDQAKKNNPNKKRFVIEVPGRDEQMTQKNHSNNIGNYNNSYQEERFKEPPAPSKGSKNNKIFIFPVTPAKVADDRKQKQFAKNNEKQTSQSKQQIKKSFERERLQFYKQKSKLEKEILIKNGQIQMLHKLLTQNITTSNQRGSKASDKYSNTYSYEQLQSILMQKDIQINQILVKVSDLNNILNRKNEQNNKKIAQLNSALCLIQSLKNQIYVYQKKQESEKLTKKFYHQQIQRTSKAQGEQFVGISGVKDFGSKGLQNLYKRIQLVRLNRIQYDTRNKIKSDVSYSQTTKNRPKGVFDFKGKTFEGPHNLNRTRMF